MPIEKKPKKLAPRIPENGPQIKHRVSNDESFVTIASKHQIDVWKLIRHNFQTDNPDEVNWYLREYVGCNVATEDRKNWKFSSSSHPGNIYIPITNRKTEPVEPPCPEMSKWERGFYIMRKNYLSEQIRECARQIYRIKTFAAGDGSSEFQHLISKNEAMLMSVETIVSSMPKWAPSATDVKVDLKGKHWRLKEYEKMIKRQNKRLDELIDELQQVMFKLRGPRCSRRAG